MNILGRYIAREIYAATALVLVAFLGLFAFFDLIHELEDLGKGGYQLHHAALYVALSLPSRAYELLPIAVLIGSLFALTTLARHSEITVIRTSGLSTRRLLAALMRIGVVFCLAILLTGEFIAPFAEKTAEQIRLHSLGSVVGQQFRSGLWLKDEGAFINVRTVLPEGGLRGVRIYEFDADYALKTISEAQEGEYVIGTGWHLKQVMRTQFHGDQVSVVKEESMDWATAVTPDMLNVLLVSPEHMSVINLWQYISHLSENHQNTGRFEIALWKKLIYPLAALVMMALALPFAFSQTRQGGVSVRVFVGIMLGILFHMLNGLFSSLGVINSWPPAMAAATPSLLFMTAAAGMLWWSERR